MTTAPHLQQYLDSEDPLPKHYEYSGPEDLREGKYKIHLDYSYTELSVSLVVGGMQSLANQFMANEFQNQVTELYVNAIEDSIAKLRDDISQHGNIYVDPRYEIAWDEMKYASDGGGDMKVVYPKGVTLYIEVKSIILPVILIGAIIAAFAIFPEPAKVMIESLGKGAGKILSEPVKAAAGPIALGTAAVLVFFILMRGKK